MEKSRQTRQKCSKKTTSICFDGTATYLASESPNAYAGYIARLVDGQSDRSKPTPGGVISGMAGVESARAWVAGEGILEEDS
jgi:hypothetical protein